MNQGNNWRLEKGIRYLETGRPDLLEYRAEVKGIECRVWYEPPGQQCTEGGWCWSVGPPVEYADTADSKEQAMTAATREAARW